VGEVFLSTCPAIFGIEIKPRTTRTDRYIDCKNNSQNAAHKIQRGRVMGWEDVVGVPALWPLVQWCVVWLRLWLEWFWRGVLRFHLPRPVFRCKVLAHEAGKVDEGQSTAPDAPASKPYRVNRKPEWAIAEVLCFKAHMPKQGCRKVADAFNQKHGPACTVSKSWVAEILKRNQYALWCLSREIKNKKPTPTAVNAVWAMDLTFQMDAEHQQQTMLGIIDHGSRALLCLQTIFNKNSWTLLGQLCLAIGRYGKPKAMRTDNERVFTGWLFKLFFTMAGIKHQRIALHSPWQNGRIERLFGTLKPLLKQLVIPGQAALQMALDEFKLFYNHCRTHQNLDGLTPAQAWNKTTWADLKQNPPKEITLVHALDGLYVGYHIRR
jgi:putative transposase